MRVVIIAVCLTTSVGLGAQTASAPRAADFLNRLQHAVDAVDRRAVATMVAYPLTVLASGFNIPVKDSANLVRMYDAVFTPELRCAIADAVMPAAGSRVGANAVIMTPDTLSLASGAVWAPLKNGRYLISRIRVPPPAPSVEGRKAIERVSFAQDKGERTAALTGWLVRRNVDVFVVHLRKGETITARIEGFRGHDGTLRLMETTATPPPKTADEGRLGSATAHADTDYRLEVAHLARYCDPPQRYKLTIAVR